MKNYSHLTKIERHQIVILRKAGHSNLEIANQLARSPSTISRELNRNAGL